MTIDLSQTTTLELGAVPHAQVPPPPIFKAWEPDVLSQVPDARPFPLAPGEYYPSIPEPLAPSLVGMAAVALMAIRRRVARVLGAAAVVLVASCADSGRVPVAILRTEPVAPSVQTAGGKVQDAGKSAAVIKQQNKELSNTVKHSAAELDLAVKQAEELAKAGKATKDQLDDALTFLRKEQAAKVEMQQQIDSMSGTIDALNQQIESASKDIAAALEKASKADQAQKTLAATAEAQTARADSQAKAADEWKSKYEAAAPYQHAAHIVYWCIGIYIVLILCKLLAPPPYSVLFALVPIPKL